MQKPQPKTKLHAIRLHVTVAEHDLNRQIAQAQQFLTKRNQVRILVQLRGRERSRPQVAIDLLSKVVEKLSEHGVAQNQPSVQNLNVLLNPKKKNN